MCCLGPPSSRIQDGLNLQVIYWRKEQQWAGRASDAAPVWPPWGRRARKQEEQEEPRARPGLARSSSRSCPGEVSACPEWIYLDLHCACCWLERACRKLGWGESERAAHGRGWRKGMGWRGQMGWKSRVEEGCTGEGWRGMKEGAEGDRKWRGWRKGMRHVQQEIWVVSFHCCQTQGIRELKYIYLFTQLLCGEIMVQTQALGIHIPYFSHCASSFLIWDDVVLWNFQFFEFI